MKDSFDKIMAVPEYGRVTDLQIVLWVRERGDPPVNQYEARYEFHIPEPENPTGDYRVGDLVPHLTTAQKTALMAFVDTMLVKAQAAGG